LHRVRAVIYGCASVAALTLCSPSAARGALATSASALVEATPFLLAGLLLGSLLRRRTQLVAMLGCGCGNGASARSLPAAAVTAFAFGPLVALARFAAAMLVAWAVQRRDLAAQRDFNAGGPYLLLELAAMLPSVLIAGVTAPLLAQVNAATIPLAGKILAGALFGFVAAPCGLGAIAIAAALRVHTPVAATAFLCVAGIVDLRALRAGQSHRHLDHDALGYFLLAAAMAFIAWRRGDTLVHPAFSIVLWMSAGTAFVFAFVYVRKQCAPARIAPALMLIGALIGAPAPVYRATQTSLTDLFAGERITFTGMLTCDSVACAIVRYAITCCRADATPIAIRLDRPPRGFAGEWLRIDGHIADVNGDLRLVADHIQEITPPSDPFVYK
jgi:hypothetical protein